MNAEDFIAAINERDTHISSLIEYAQGLEELLREKRSNEASDAAYQAADTEIAEARYKCGLRSSLSLR